ncbi:alpha/beta fold hydrolase [Ignavigranum ruoffiae]|uniref:alpha/beta fold hydrolase n=1 Tax=Ignavigranum ruoffiae TaxID=89093 RepID=UPI0024ADBFEE|nr:alpha/beta hydrolase [Ignavigranum ruoffiae]
MEHLIFHSDLGDIHYWLSKIDANRPTLVFTHGVLINHETFDPQIKYFAKDYNIITWDLPLHGLSKECTGFTLRASAEIMQGILDKEGIDQVILVGQSLGGFFSQEFADRYPDRVKAFIGIDTAPYGRRYYPDKRLMQFFEPSMSSLTNPWQIPETWYTTFTGLFAAFTPMTYQRMMKWLQPYSAADLRRICLAAYQAIINENRDIKRQHPTLLLLGQFDCFGIMMYYSLIWNVLEHIPLRIIPFAGHIANNDNPWAVNHEIQSFIEKVA